MRILVTHEGKLIMQDIERSRSQTMKTFYPSIFSKSNSSMNIRKKDPMYESSELFRIKEMNKKRKNNALNKKNNFISKGEGTLSQNDIGKAKKIKIEKTKFNELYKKWFPNYDNYAEESANQKLESIKDIFKTNTPNEPNVINKQLNLYKENNEPKEKLKEEINIKEIIPKQIIKGITEKYINDVKLKYENKKLNENEFRSTYEKKIDDFVKLDDSLKLNIKRDRVNLIQYLNKHNSISPLSLYNLRNYSQEKMGKLNKVCQILNHENELQKRQYGLSLHKLYVKNNLEIAQDLKNLKTLKNFNLKLSHDIIDEYNRRETIKHGNISYYKNKLISIYKKNWNTEFINRQYKHVKFGKFNTFLDEEAK